jgi:hypothetical protein
MAMLNINMYLLSVIVFIIAFTFTYASTTSEAAAEAEAASSSNEKTSRIHGGWDTNEDRYSYAQVSLTYKSEGHQCGGSLIAPDVVLTASHCSGSFDKIVIGKHQTNDITDLAETFVSKLELIHPKYDEVATRYDTMLIFLNSTSTMGRPVRINNNDQLPIHGSMLTVIGWGYNAEWDLPDVLQETYVQYSQNSQCDDLIDEDGITLAGDLFGDMMCAGSDGRDSCYGDSGSPLILTGDTEDEDMQMGLVSWGYECAGHLPGVYSRLSYYHNYEFLEEQVCLLSVQPPDYMNCEKWTKPPTNLPTIAPTQYPTVSPTTIKPTEVLGVTAAPAAPITATTINTPVGVPAPAESVPATPTNTVSASPTTTLRGFLEGTASIPVSKTMDVVQQQGATTSSANASDESSSADAALCSTILSSYATVTSAIIFGTTTWICILTLL